MRPTFIRTSLGHHGLFFTTCSLRGRDQDRPPLSHSVSKLKNCRTLCGSASAACISSHWNSLLQHCDILEVLESAVEFPAVDGLRSLAGVLEADSQVAATAASRAGTGNAVGGGVADLMRNVSDRCKKTGRRMRP